MLCLCPPDESKSDIHSPLSSVSTNSWEKHLVLWRVSIQLACVSLWAKLTGSAVLAAVSLYTETFHSVSNIRNIEIYLCSFDSDAAFLSVNEEVINILICDSLCLWMKTCNIILAHDGSCLRITRFIDKTWIL